MPTPKILKIENSSIKSKATASLPMISPLSIWPTQAPTPSNPKISKKLAKIY